MCLYSHRQFHCCSSTLSPLGLTNQEELPGYVTPNYLYLSKSKVIVISLFLSIFIFCLPLSVRFVTHNRIKQKENLLFRVIEYVLLLKQGEMIIVSKLNNLNFLNLFLSWITSVGFSFCVFCFWNLFSCKALLRHTPDFLLWSCTARDLNVFSHIIKIFE